MGGIKMETFSEMSATFKMYNLEEIRTGPIFARLADFPANPSPLWRLAIATVRSVSDQVDRNKSREDHGVCRQEGRCTVTFVSSKKSSFNELPLRVSPFVPLCRRIC